MQATVLMLATTIHKSNTTPHHQSLGQQQDPHPHNLGAKGRPPPPTGQRRGLVVSKPNSVSDDSAPVFPHRIVKFVECTRP